MQVIWFKLDFGLRLFFGRQRHGIWFGNGKSAQLWICYIWTEMRRWTWQFQFGKWGIISNSYCSMFWLTLTSSRLNDVNSSNSFWISCSNDVNFKSNFEMRRVSIAAGSLVSSSQIEIYRFVCPGSSSVFLEIWNWTASTLSWGDLLSTYFREDGCQLTSLGQGKIRGVVHSRISCTDFKSPKISLEL